MRTGFLLALLAAVTGAISAQTYEYRVLATNKTSTMEREMNDAASAGYSFGAVMGGETAFGGNEVVIIMRKESGGGGADGKRYKLLAARRTSTMQKELQALGAEGFEYRGQTAFDSTFGGREVAVILERNATANGKRFQYRLLSTQKTSTMEKELQAAGAEGFQLLGMTVAKTSFGGDELLCVLGKDEAE